MTSRGGVKLKCVRLWKGLQHKYDIIKKSFNSKRNKISHIALKAQCLRWMHRDAKSGIGLDLRLGRGIEQVLMSRKAGRQTLLAPWSDRRTNYCELRLLEKQGVFQFGNNEENFETARVLFQLWSVFAQSLILIFMISNLADFLSFCHILPRTKCVNPIFFISFVGNLG